jgi:predicted DNA-binding transcriptional regulator AlpA
VSKGVLWWCWKKKGANLGFRQVDEVGPELRNRREGFRKHFLACGTLSGNHNFLRKGYVVRRRSVQSVISSWVSKAEVGEHLSVCQRTVDRWANDGIIPPGVKMGANGVLRWKLAEIDEWLAKKGGVARG